LIIAIFVAIMALSGLFLVYPAPLKQNGPAETVKSGMVDSDLTPADVKPPVIIDNPVLITDYRRQLTREYSLMHYGEPLETIVPRAIVVHWTASDSCEGVFNYFKGEEAQRDREYGKLNLTAHFLVDKDGAIYRLTPENQLNRHAIGLNWCSIGIENVGGAGGKEDLTQAQLQSNTELVRYLKSKHPTIEYLLGHYQQDQAKKAGLWKEKIAGYNTGKPDPGRQFMEKLIDNTKDVGLITFPLE